MRQQNFEFEALGTHWRIDIEDINSEDIFSEILLAIQQCIAEFEQHYSRFREDSLITKMSQHAGTYTLPSDAKLLLDFYWQLYQLTNGAFTPFIGQTLTQAGYDAHYSFKPKPLTQLPTWEEVIEYDFPTIILKQAIQLDFGGLGKGYMIDLLAEILQKNNISNFTIDAGGDIFYRNTNNNLLQIGLEDPRNLEQVIGAAQITNQSLCGSSGNRRSWNQNNIKYHHIINPHTLESPQNILATWVVADTTLVADGMATCLFLVPSLQLVEHFNFEYLIVYQDYSIQRSANFPAELYISP